MSKPSRNTTKRCRPGITVEKQGVTLYSATMLMDAAVAIVGEPNQPEQQQFIDTAKLRTFRVNAITLIRQNYEVTLTVQVARLDTNKILGIKAVITECVTSKLAEQFRPYFRADHFKISLQEQAKATGPR